ncbi:hypothetical protein GGS23DRAFT_570188 [Durotheca rogersii]|uniref:uncharacterized protein n=1 Tax=Durotheca rogersii TaxID=419775 RepID=UPI00221F1264|nr:uncharacterized protein GGS23DRAFT_570188 [Durotheca rogersii]KAI5862924.1 hypothetical protein GGS23DRAFT_570188 [Durotheca rogersii]
MSERLSDRSPLDVAPRPGIDARLSSSVSISTFGDPRLSSTQSLVPSSPFEETGRRKLLVIYIHGYMGSDASFQSFPAHVHRYLKLALADTHAIHSKIYPRYKTYKALRVGRDSFSSWLAPHESPNTDVVLVGHSMGGLLAADVALMLSGNQHEDRYFLHRILGTISLDAPLLGLHPSVITTGIASLFQPKPDVKDLPEEPIPEDESTQPSYYAPSTHDSVYSGPSSTSQASLSSSIPYGMTFDPNFNPSFMNDIRLQDRGWWGNIVHFVEKHSSENILDAATSHIMSHLEYGGALMDIAGLKARYESIRRLEDVDDLKHQELPHIPPRVRFLQYYTVCHGPPKQTIPRKPSLSPETSSIPREPRSPTSTTEVPSRSRSNTPSLRTRMDAILEEGISPLDSHEADSDGSLTLLSPQPISEGDQPIPSSCPSLQSLEGPRDKPLESYIPASGSFVKVNDIEVDCPQDHSGLSPQGSSQNGVISTARLGDSMASLNLDLPEIPELPTKPEPPDLDRYLDKETRKQAEKEAKRAEKDYAKRVKDRERTIKERQKIIDKRKKKLTHETEKREKEEKRQRRKEESAAVKAKSSVLGEGSVDTHDPPTGYPDSAPSERTQRELNSNTVPPVLGPQEEGEDGMKPPKKLKNRKFCNLPPKVDGEVDSKWIKVFMKDMDQVTAHTSLFFRGEHYERLVGDVGEAIVGWVQEDMTKRAILELRD